MQRIAIIGSCGAGKSTLSVTLAKKLNLPVIHLDSYYWQPGWQESNSDRWQEIHQKLIEGDRWIIDGNYGGTMELRLSAADTIIWLDFNRYLCLWRVVKRYLQYAGKTRPDMAKGCPEQFNWEFLRYVWHFPEMHRCKIVERLDNFSSNKRIKYLGKINYTKNECVISG
ncbi:DNA topology modulation protein, partial [Waterburya agarophytonicola K14]